MALQSLTSQTNFSLLNSPIPSQKSLSSKPLISYFNSSPTTRRKIVGFPVVRSSLNLPVQTRSRAGKSLSSVLQNDPESFYDAVSVQLNKVAEDREAAFARFDLSLGSPEASLHRRIAELKEAESQLAVEDVLYMIILYKFSEIRVPLVPSLSKCLYNGRLEILPSKDWELESVYSREVLEMVRDHLTTVLGWKAGSSVSVNWSTTEVHRVHLSHIYAASILYGYFLKSASLRFHLEHNLPQAYQKVPSGSWTPTHNVSYGVENAILGQVVTPRSTTLSQASTRLGKKEAKLSRYVMGFDLQTRKLCGKVRTEEAVRLIEKQFSALFAGERACSAENDELILTSLSSLKRLVLEAVAFGCFLWDAEQCVDGIYKLKDR